MVIIPESKYIQIVHGIGYSAAAIGEAALFDDKFLELSGEGNYTLGMSNLHFFDPSIVNMGEVFNPVDELIKIVLAEKGRDDQISPSPA